eukprot:3367190-Lingulodinium_polyedra.AAC.1
MVSFNYDAFFFCLGVNAEGRQDWDVTAPRFVDCWRCEDNEEDHEEDQAAVDQDAGDISPVEQEELWVECIFDDAFLRLLNHKDGTADCLAFLCRLVL